MQAAIALSLAGSSSSGLTGATTSSIGRTEAGTEAGWGARLAQQEASEERRYKEEAERARTEEEEQLRQALAMSMDIEESSPPAPARAPAPKSTPAVANP